MFTYADHHFALLVLNRRIVLTSLMTCFLTNKTNEFKCKLDH